MAQEAPISRREERGRVTIAFQPAPAEAGAKLGEFDITLRKVG